MGHLRDAAPFSRWLSERAAAADPFSYAVMDRAGRAVGIATLMEIRPAMRVIEVGHIVYAPALQRTPLATEAQYLLARYAFEDARLPPLRMEMQRAQCAVAPRGVALRLHLRRHFPPAHDRQGPQPRYRLVRHARSANGRRANRPSRRGWRLRISPPNGPQKDRSPRSMAWRRDGSADHVRHPAVRTRNVRDACRLLIAARASR